MIRGYYPDPLDGDTLTPGQALQMLRELSLDTDTEHAHVAADDVLCCLLLHLGHGDVVDAYTDIEKWFC